MNQKVLLFLVTATVCCPLVRASISNNVTLTRVCPVDSQGNRRMCNMICGERNEVSCPRNQLCCSNCCQDPIAMCLVNGIVRQAGVQFDADDGCNTCVCEESESGGVTIICTERMCTTATRVCPPVTVGSCGAPCSEDAICINNLLCCPDNCGKSCIESVVACLKDGVLKNIGEMFDAEDGCNTCHCTENGEISCTEIVCPQCCPRFLATSATSCDVGCDLDAEDSGCDEGLLCCTNGCGGTSCVKPVTVCEGHNGVRYQVGDSIVSEDGCNTCTCGRLGVMDCTKQICQSVIGCPRNPPHTPEICANPRNMACNDQIPCNDDQRCCTGLDGCSVCMFSVCTDGVGNEYRVGETFSVGDGCNNCTCLASGRVSCTSRVCMDSCYLRPVPSGDNCTTPATRYYFEPSLSICLSFEGGCGSQGQNNFASLSDCNKSCNQHTPECDDPVLCSANPCDISTCPNIPNAKCVPNFCGGCNADYFDGDGSNVTDRCEMRETCEQGSPVVRCLMDPCDVASCPQFPGAKCVSNYCGGCNYDFVDSSGDMVPQCNNDVPVPLIVEFCPLLNQSIGGICIDSCTSDTSCTDDELCCSNGCGRACMTPMFIPFYSIPSVCPEIELRDLFRSCDGTEGSCSMHSDCNSENKLCCRDILCGKRCKEAIKSSTPCLDVVNQILEASSYREDPTMYIPTCNSEGTFNPVQCDGSSATTGLCWCVDVRNGRPVSSYSPRGIRPQCSGCSYNGTNYTIGSSFPSKDGCNKCLCEDGGLVSCTTGHACADPCSLPPDAGPCRASIQAFYYDQEVEKCLPFTYGGCGGNSNKFKSVKDCLLRCNPKSKCIETPIFCDRIIQSYFFNGTTGQCETIISRGCGKSENIFSTGTECFEECSPGVIPVNKCLDVRCEELSCPSGSEITIDDRHCCPYCGPTGHCEISEYRCADGTCIPEMRICDRLVDCLDGADEEQCENECEFTCGDRTCIRSSQVCDGILDCNDGADVKNCTEGFSNVYYLTERDIPVHCPASSDSLGACVIQCDSDDNCTSGTICCENECGRTCVIGDRFQLRCVSVLRQSMQSEVIGVFRPECQDDGAFSPVQCHGSTGYCWCVDIDSGQPISEGVRGERPVCGSCTRRNGEEVAVGESYRSEDGCNTCICTGQNSIICSRKPCNNAPCRFQNRMVPSNTSIEDECNACHCAAGSLRCSRKPCVRAAVAGAVAQKRLIIARLPFAGDFSSIQERLDDFKREVKRSFLDMYATTLGVTQDQIQKIDVIEGSVIIIVTLAESNSTITGANLTVLVGQVEQDFEMGILVIRYDNQILTPSGELQIDEEISSKRSTRSIIIVSIIVVVISSMAMVVLILLVVAFVKMRIVNNIIAGGDRCDEPHGVSSPPHGTKSDLEENTYI